MNDPSVFVIVRLSDHHPEHRSDERLVDTLEQRRPAEGRERRHAQPHSLGVGADGVVRSPAEQRIVSSRCQRVSVSRGTPGQQLAEQHAAERQQG
jgi:hypothetical protein